MTRSLLSAREHRVEIERGVSRKQLSTACRDACAALDLRPTLRSVLIELVGHWRENPLNGQLIVWPSNETLMGLTGLSERAIRNATRALIDQGVIAPRDSANGKRYARFNAAGELVEAYGFDLAPLHERAGEFAAIVEQQRRERDEHSRRFEALTIARRGCQEALQALLTDFPEAASAELADRLESLLSRIPKRRPGGTVGDILEEVQNLRTAIEKTYNDTASAGIRCRHIESNNESPNEVCETRLREDAERVRSVEPDSLVDLVRDACPAYRDYTTQQLQTVDDLVAIAAYLRYTIGAHQQAWQEASAAITPLRAALCVLHVVQLYSDDQASGANRIRNPGGYFRALARKVAEKTYNIEAELHLSRRRKAAKQKVC